MGKRMGESNVTSLLAKLKGEFDGAKSRAVAVTLARADWSNRQQTVAVSGLGKTQNGIICLSQDVSVSEYEAASAAGLFVSAQTEGELIVGYTGDTPTCDIPATVILLG